MKTQLSLFAGVCLVAFCACSNENEISISEKEVVVEILVPVSITESEIKNGTGNIFRFTGSAAISAGDFINEADENFEIVSIVPGKESKLSVAFAGSKYSVGSIDLEWQSVSGEELKVNGIISVDPGRCIKSIQNNVVTFDLGQELTPLFYSINHHRESSFTIAISGTSASELKSSLTLQLQAMVSTRSDSPRFELF